MKPSLSLKYIAEASALMLELRRVLLLIANAESLDEAQKMAKETLKRTLKEDDE